jgi:hypothetical protein
MKPSPTRTFSGWEPAVSLAHNLGHHRRLALTADAGRYPSMTELLAIRLLCVVAVLLGAVEATAQSGGGPVLTIVPYNSFSFRLYASGWQSTNFVLESSSDMKSWTNVFQAFGWPGTNSVYGGFYEMASPAQQFWRARPGQPLVMQEQQWTNHEPVHYSFRLRHMISYWQGGVQGTVQVLNGAVVEVTNAVDDRTLKPIANPDLSQFFTITQLFEQIRQGFEAGVHQVRVRYDPGGLYPEYILVDPLLSVVDDESVFEVSQFMVLQP